MKDTSAGELSIDDAILDYLSKKEIKDRTEKLALTRIASKLATSIELVQTSINRLSAKNLVRKIYLQGEIGFELTPRGKSAIEDQAKAQAKARADLVTKQLQEAIHQERVAKLRTATIDKMISAGDKWQNYSVPDRNLMDDIKIETSKLLEITKETKAKQPLCNEDPQNYDQKFAQYKSQIQNLIQQNSSLTKTVNNYTKIKDYRVSLSDDIEKITKAIAKYELITEVATQVSQLKTVLCQLKQILSELEKIDEEHLSQFEELKIKLSDSSKILEILKKSTHEFVPIKRESSIEKPVLYPDPEGPIKYERKTSGIPLEEKCQKCGTKRKLTPVNIG